MKKTRDFENIRIIKSPIASLGKKTRYVQTILRYVPKQRYDRWLEPFAGSCVVGFTEQPENAVFSDVIPYGMQFFQKLKNGIYNPIDIQDMAEKIAIDIEFDNKVYKQLREHFEENRDSLDYLFLSIFCRNNILEFKKNGGVSGSAGRIPRRTIRELSQTLTEIMKSIRKTWEFKITSYENIFYDATKKDIVYVDPPIYFSGIQEYHVWTEEKQKKFREDCFALPCPCMATLWLERRGKINNEIEEWEKNGFSALSYPVQISFNGRGKDVLLVRS